MNPTQEMMDGYEALKQHHREHHTELAEKDAEIKDLKADRARIIKSNTCPSCTGPLTDLADKEDPDWVIGKHCENCYFSIDEMGEHRG